MALQSVTLNVEGMSCMHCVGAVKKAVSSLDGVSRVDVSLEEKKAVVEFDPGKVSVDSMKAAIEEQGYQVV